MTNISKQNFIKMYSFLTTMNLCQNVKTWHKNKIYFLYFLLFLDYYFQVLFHNATFFCVCLKYNTIIQWNLCYFQQNIQTKASKFPHIQLWTIIFQVGTDTQIIQNSICLNLKTELKSHLLRELTFRKLISLEENACYVTGFYPKNSMTGKSIAEKLGLLQGGGKKKKVELRWQTT